MGIRVLQTCWAITQHHTRAWSVNAMWEMMSDHGQCDYPSLSLMIWCMTKIENDQGKLI
jgi:hypothetical protein